MLGQDIEIGDLIRNRSRLNPSILLVLAKRQIGIPFRQETLIFLEFEFFELGTARKIKMHLSPDREYKQLDFIPDLETSEMGIEPL